MKTLNVPITAELAKELTKTAIDNQLKVRIIRIREIIFSHISEAIEEGLYTAKIDFIEHLTKPVRSDINTYFQQLGYKVVFGTTSHSNLGELTSVVFISWSAQ